MLLCNNDFHLLRVYTVIVTYATAFVTYDSTNCGYT